MGRATLTYPFIVTALFLSPVARAQTSDKALAEAMFQDGRQLFEKGETARACKRFAVSQRIEPKLGTLLNLASCHEKEGRTASAWAEFIEGETQATRKEQPDRAAFARTHAQALGERLSQLVLHSQSNVEGIEIWVDGVRLGAVEGTALPVDPGERSIDVKAPGKRTWTTRVVVPVGPSSTRIDIPLLETEATQESRAPAGQAKVQLRERPSDSGRTSAGWIALTVGGVATGLGAIYGSHAISKKSQADRECAGEACSANGLAMHDDAKMSAAVATVAFSVGIVGVAVGTYLLLSGGGRKTAPPAAIAGHGAYSLSLHF